MQATARLEFPPRLIVLLTLAQLLERMEQGQLALNADQYRSVVEHLKQELQAVTPDEDFRRILRLSPATAELYEDLQYEHAGLCCSPLEASLESEWAARMALQRAADVRGPAR